MPITCWIYTRDKAGRWLPAVALPFTSTESADRILAALLVEFPDAQLRIETDITGVH